MTLKEAIKRIEELERKVKELEARPQHHYHFYSPSYPVYVPQPYYIAPQLPYQPYSPWPIGPTWTAGAAGQAADNHLTFNA